MLPGTVWGWVVLPGYVDGCVVVGAGVVDVEGVVVWAIAAADPKSANAMIFNFKTFITMLYLVDESFQEQAVVYQEPCQHPDRVRNPISVI